MASGTVYYFSRVFSCVCQNLTTHFSHLILSSLLSISIILVFVLLYVLLTLFPCSSLYLVPFSLPHPPPVVTLISGSFIHLFLFFFLHVCPSLSLSKHLVIPSLLTSCCLFTLCLILGGPHTHTHTHSLFGAYRRGCRLICCLLWSKTETALFADAVTGVYLAVVQ